MLQIWDKSQKVIGADMLNLEKSTTLYCLLCPQHIPLAGLVPMKPLRCLHIHDGRQFATITQQRLNQIKIEDSAYGTALLTIGLEVMARNVHAQ